jgi:hypothetical protein
MYYVKKSVRMFFRIVLRETMQRIRDDKSASPHFSQISADFERSAAKPLSTVSTALRLKNILNILQISEDFEYACGCFSVRALYPQHFPTSRDGLCEKPGLVAPFI